MNATRRHSGEAGSSRGASDAAVRGGLLIAVAVVIGLLLLWRAHDESDASTDVVTQPTTPTDGGAGTTLPPEGGGSTTVPTETTVPTATTHVPNQVPVLVANGSGTKGGAAAVTNKLHPLGYDTKPAADADTRYEKSRVFYREGFAEDAKAIARALAVPEPVEAIIEAMPEPPPVQGTQGTASAAVAQVLVLLGTDGVISQS